MVSFVMVLVVSLGEELLLALHALVRSGVAVDALVHSEVALVRERFVASGASKGFYSLML